MCVGLLDRVPGVPGFHQREHSRLISLRAVGGRGALIVWGLLCIPLRGNFQQFAVEFGVLEPFGDEQIFL